MFGQAGFEWCIPFPYAESGAAMALYKEARGRAVRSQWWARLTGRSRALLSLKDVSQAGSDHSHSSAGIRAVPIAQIRGSENRADDFDCDFNPLQERTCERWLSIARAWQRGVSLPPVYLIQVGEYYFVRDGHHRISVARALGQESVEASVDVWIVDEPLPWEKPTQERRRKDGQAVAQPV